MENNRITLAHGNGGRLMRELIAHHCAAPLGSAGPDLALDAAPLPDADGQWVITTDGFTVQPLEFPGGNIGSLAVHGTVNDLAVSGARPVSLTVSAFLEEGLEIALLDRLMRGFAAAARECGVKVVAGDTKVVPRGEGSGLYLSTTGVGVRPRELTLSIDQIQSGDRLLVSGPVGDHGAAVMLAREEFGLRGELRSDAASVFGLAQALIGLPGLRFMRDPTRGGLATAAHDIARGTGLSVRLSEPGIPVRDPVRSVCDILGYDPYYLACEGRVLAVVSPADTDAALNLWRHLPGGELASIIGQVEEGVPQLVLETELGGERLLEELESDPLPRIC